MEHFMSFPLRACVRYRQSDICETDERVGCSLLSVNTSGMSSFLENMYDFHSVSVTEQ